MAFHPGLGHLFVVGDDGALAEIDTSGKVVRALGVEKQLEDVAYHPPSGGLLVVSESRSELILFDPAAGRELKRWKLNTPALLGRMPTEANQGFEGLAFRPDPSRPGGGLVYLSHQRAPSVVVAVAFDPTGRRPSTRRRWSPAGRFPGTTTSPRCNTSPPSTAWS